MDDSEIIEEQETKMFLESEFCSACGCIINLSSSKLPVKCVACGHPLDASGNKREMVLFKL